MHAALAAVAFAAGANALATGNQGCCFGLSATGGPGGQLAQIYDGQNRIGQSGIPTGSYCLNNGALTDSYGRGCILTPPTAQFQCDVGASPSPGFAVSSNGTLSVGGESEFWACPTGDHGGWNIYSEWLHNQTKCVPVTLAADNCHASPSSSVAPPPPPSSMPVVPVMYMPTPMVFKPKDVTETDCTTMTLPGHAAYNATTKPSPSTASPTAPPAAKGTCPAELKGDFEFPHLMIPVDSAHPDKAYGTSLNGTLSGTMSTMFNFDIPASDAGKQCTVEFLFPTQDALETSAYDFSGDGLTHFYKLTDAATKNTTMNSLGGLDKALGGYRLSPGTATAISTFACPAGQTIGIWMKAFGKTNFTYFQDFNPCPIGLYITKK